MKYIKKLEQSYPLEFFGYRDGELPKEGMLYFVERNYFNLSFMPRRDLEVYKVTNGKWFRGTLKKTQFSEVEE